jgi:hypothetical protein
VDESGRIRYFQHDLVGKKIIGRRAKQLRLSNVEVERLECIVRHHLRPILLAQDGGSPTRRAIYRFFRDTGACGVDICLLSLADVMGTYGPTLPQDAWAHHVEVVRILLEAWWERPQESVSPPVLITGDDLIEALVLKPGRQIGWILESIREAQSEGQVTNREEALALARELARSSPHPTESD